MCEPTSDKYKIPAMDFLRERSLNEILTPQVRKTYRDPMHKGHCFSCGKALSEKERNPRGRATRSLCTPCYDELIANTINHNCIICWGSLPNGKVEAQQYDPREVRNHIHNGECTHIWVILHNYANAEPDPNDARPIRVHPQQIAHQPQPHFQLPHFSGVPFEDQDITQIPVNSILRHQFQINQNGINIRKPTPVKRVIPKTLNNKPVRVIDKIGR